MSSRSFPQLPRAIRDGKIDWPVLQAGARKAALAVGLATRKPPLTTPEPLLPGLAVTDRVTARMTDRLTKPVEKQAEKKPQEPPRVEGPLLARTVARLGILSVGTVLGGLLILAIGVVLSRPAVSSAKALLEVQLDIPDKAALPELEERSSIYDGDNNLLAVIDREVSRRSVPLGRVPRHVREAVITAEDRKFYEHAGYDPEGMARAFVANIKAGSVTEGGSTITQQLAKSQVGQERTLERKAAELLYAQALERRFDKDELLERYLNQVYFGSRAYGIAAAAEEFFHTTAGELKVHHSALLASLIRSPNSADPRDHKQLALQRRNQVLEDMAVEGYLNPARVPRLIKRPLGVKESSPRRATRQPHVVDAVQRELLTLPQLGKTRKARERKLYYGGLRITTTLDLEMQTTATNVIRDFLPAASPTAAIATVDPATGAIKAIASGLGYEDLKYDLPTQGRRQPGSAFKPFIYAAALQDGFPLEMSLSGKSPAYFKGVPGWEQDCRDEDKEICGVSNYEGASYGELDMPKALQNSVNTAAAQLTITLGPKRVAKMAEDMGVNIDAATNGQITESIGLGGLDQGVTPLEMASAYSVFANNGERVKPHLIAKVQDRDGKVIYEAKQTSEKVLDPVVDAVMIDMMRGVVTGGTGTGAALPTWPVAGKTGTTTSNVDAWFVGYTPVLSTAVWVGHAEGQIEMPGMTGGSLPATIWRTYMGEVLDGRGPEAFPEPDLAALAARYDDTQFGVPDVVGMTEAEALTLLGKKRFIGEVREESSALPEGRVIWQSPGPDDTATPGETVYIGVSSGYVAPPPPPPSTSSGGSSSSDDVDEEEPPPPEEEEPPPPEEEEPPPPEEEEPAPEEEEPPEEDTGNGNGNGNGNGGNGVGNG